LNAGKKVWDEQYAPRGGYNYGIGGDSTRQLLWRMQNGELDGINPRVLVLMIGTNNLYNDYNNGTDEEVVEGIKVVVQKIRAKLPHTKILLLGLLPRDSVWLTDRIQEINKALQYLPDYNWVFMLNMFHEFEELPGYVNKSLFTADQLHPNEAGYKHWAQLMEPLLKELLDVREEGDITHKQPAADKPWVPAWGWWGQSVAWKYTHESLMHQSRESKDDIKAIFLGDEITYDWVKTGLYLIVKIFSTVCETKQKFSDFFPKRIFFNTLKLSNSLIQNNSNFIQR
jgi:lysophospholipase L1-like esterase